MKKLAQVKTITLVCCGQGFNKEYKGHYNRYKVLLNYSNGVVVPIEKAYENLDGLSYWQPRSKVMAMQVWGSSQEYEAMLALGRFMFGLYDKKGKETWSDYAKRVTSNINVIY